MNSDKTSMKAIWVPSWYGLDQPLGLGERRAFSFFVVPPLDCLAIAEEVDLVFFNELPADKNTQLREATIAEMNHPKLGLLQRIYTEGLDYIFVPVQGEQVVVNAEEFPGKNDDDSVHIDDWSVFVFLTDMESPKPKST